MVAAKPDREQQQGLQRMRKPAKRFGSEEESPEPTSKLGSKKPDKVHVWWPPTRNAKRTGFSGAWWPAAVRKVSEAEYTVQYDNGETEAVNAEHIFPYDLPVAFGQEEEPLQVGEFVEVSNGSKTDPCGWLGRVSSIGKTFTVKYPFHDTPAEQVKPSLVRRARVWDRNTWNYIQLGQKWKSGEVTSPLELNLLHEKEYFRELKAGKQKKQQDTPSSAQPAKKQKAASSSKPAAAQRAQQVPGAVKGGSSSSSGAANGAVSESGSKGTKRGREEVPDARKAGKGQDDHQDEDGSQTSAQRLRLDEEGASAPGLGSRALWVQQHAAGSLDSELMAAVAPASAVAPEQHGSVQLLDLPGLAAAAAACTPSMPQWLAPAGPGAANLAAAAAAAAAPNEAAPTEALPVTAVLETASTEPPPALAPAAAAGAVTSPPAAGRRASANVVAPPSPRATAMAAAAAAAVSMAVPQALPAVSAAADTGAAPPSPAAAAAAATSEHGTAGGHWLAPWFTLHGGQPLMPGSTLLLPHAPVLAAASSPQPALPSAGATCQATAAAAAVPIAVESQVPSVEAAAKAAAAAAAAAEADEAEAEAEEEEAAGLEAAADDAAGLDAAAEEAAGTDAAAEEAAGEEPELPAEHDQLLPTRVSARRQQKQQRLLQQQQQQQRQEQQEEQAQQQRQRQQARKKKKKRKAAALADAFPAVPIPVVAAAAVPKVKKDSKAPTKARTAFTFYRARHRLAVQTTLSLSLKEANQHLRQLWDALPQLAKLEYEQLAVADKERFEREMATYVPPAAVEQPSSSAAAAAGGGGSTAGGLLAAAASSRQISAAASKASGAASSSKAAAAAAVVGTSAVSRPAKAIKTAQAIKTAPASTAAAGAAAAAGPAGSGAEGQPPPKPAVKKRKRDPAAPPKAKTAYILFIIDHRKTLDKATPFQEGTRLCAEAWKALPPGAKAPYEAAAAQEKAVYERRKAVYEARKRAEAQQQQQEGGVQQPPRSSSSGSARPHAPVVRLPISRPGTFIAAAGSASDSDDDYPSSALAAAVGAKRPRQKRQRPGSRLAAAVTAPEAAAVAAGHVAAEAPGSPTLPAAAGAADGEDAPGVTPQLLLVTPGVPQQQQQQQEGDGAADGCKLQHNSSNSSSIPSGMVPVQGFPCGGDGSSLLGMVPVSGMCLGPPQQQQQRRAPSGTMPRLANQQQQHQQQQRDKQQQQQQRGQQQQQLSAGSVPGLLGSPGSGRHHQEQQHEVLGMDMDGDMLDDAGSLLQLVSHSQPQRRQHKQAEAAPTAEHPDDMQLDQGWLSQQQHQQQQPQQQPGAGQDEEEHGLLILDMPRCMPAPASPVHAFEGCGLLGAATSSRAGQGVAGGLLQGAGSPGVSDDVLTALALEEPLQDLLQGGLEAAELLPVMAELLS